MAGADPLHWRSVPAGVSLGHLKAMVVREPHLVIEDHLGQLRVASLPDRARWVVGRDPACDLVVDWDASVSRSHAVIERLGAVVTIEDSGVSRNGTIVDGRRISGKALLADAATVELGYSRMHVRLAGADPAGVATVGVTGREQATSPTFSPAEHRVLLAMVEGRRRASTTPTNRQVAEALGLGIETVKSHMRSISQRLQAAGVAAPIDRDRVVDLALEGLLRLPTDEPPPAGGAPSAPQDAG